MTDLSIYQARRDALRQKYLADDRPTSPPQYTGGVDHLALISLDLEKTIQFYTEIIGMRLTKVVTNRDEPTSTHIFLDMGGGNQLAFFDFPQKDTEPTIRGVGSLHHVALKATPEQFQALLANLDAKGRPYSLYGSRENGSVYVLDPDNIQVEVTTGSGA